MFAHVKCEIHRGGRGGLWIPAFAGMTGGSVCGEGATTRVARTVVCVEAVIGVGRSVVG